MAMSHNLLPPLDRVALDHVAIFEQLPHPLIVLSPDLRIREVNSAGRRFLGKPTGELVDAALFDILPRGSAGGNDWQSRLQASYDQVRALREPVTLLLSARDSATPEAPADCAVQTADAGSKQPGGPGASTGSSTGMWHVCHGPITDQAGNLIAIATHALALCGIEAAIAQVGGFATAQLFTANRSVGSGLDAPIVAASKDAVDITAVPAGGRRRVEDEDKETDKPAGAAQPAAGQAMAILMVEDNQDLRSSTTELLQFLGHRVVSVPDAELALRQLESGSFDILFTDLTLPKMSGAELARHVLQHHRPTRVIITSGYGRAMANAQNLDAVFLPKPYRIADLEEVLAKFPPLRA